MHPIMKLTIVATDSRMEHACVSCFTRVQCHTPVDNSLYTALYFVLINFRLPGGMCLVLCLIYECSSGL